MKQQGTGSAKWLVSAIAVLALLFTNVTNPASAEPIVIKFNHVVPESSPKGQAAARFAEIANERLDGRVDVQVFPAAQLYDEDAASDALILGDLHMTAPTLAKTLPFTKKLQVFELPFLFEDVDAVDRFQRSDAGLALLDSMLDRGVKGLRYGREGMKQLHATNRPLRLPSDAAGLKFRIMPSDVLVAQFQAVGANPQKMAFSEVYHGLVTGVIDGHENTWTLIHSMKFHEAGGYITESDHGVLDYVVLTNDAFWSGLPDDIRDELETIMAEVGEWEYEQARIQTTEDRQSVIDSGLVEIIELTSEERQAWLDAMLPVWEQYEEEIGRETIDAAAAANNGH